jgi:hypothetical protein
MIRSFRLIKITLVFLVMLASMLRPVIVYAHNSQNNSISAVSASAQHQTPTVFTRNSLNSKTMRVLDKEKSDAVCLTPCFHKEWTQLESRSFQQTGAAPARSLSFQTLNLRI